MTTPVAFHTSKSPAPVHKGATVTHYELQTTNTLQEPECYRVAIVDLDGGPQIVDVLVQRKNGRFAALNQNAHRVRWGSVGGHVLRHHKA